MRLAVQATFASQTRAPDLALAAAAKWGVTRRAAAEAAPMPGRSQHGCCASSASHVSVSFPARGDRLMATHMQS